MARTTLDIDTPVLKELKRLQRSEAKSLGRLVSDLLSEALAGRKQDSTPCELVWTTRDMGALVDIRDKAALHAALDERDS
jgi:hypothetical protein